MKRLLTFLIVASLVLSPAMNVFAGNNGNGKAENTSTKEQKAEQPNSQKAEQPNLQKAFKMELNAQKKQLSQDKSALEEQKALLEAQYQELIAAGNTADAEALMLEITALGAQIQGLQSQIKQVINERFMVIKSSYSDAELAQFENAAALIEQMYEDAQTLSLGAITVKDNLIKLEGPAYIKGGRTIIPVRTITEELGADVSWNAETKTVTVSKDGIEIVFSINSTKVFVNGAEQQIDAAAEITNGRTYVPLRFIAETFGLSVDWDDESGTVDIDENADSGTGDVDEDADSGTGDVVETDPVDPADPADPVDPVV